MENIDHLVYAVPDLESACSFLENKLGVAPTFGGYHKNQGTKNALIYIGEKCYLEILAVDESNKKIKPPRWMGIDLIEKPTMTRWASTTSFLKNTADILKTYHENMGQISTGERETKDGNILKWEMALPLPDPKIEAVPFFIDWGKSETHPADNLPKKCELLSFHIFHSNPSYIRSVFQKLDINLKVEKADIPYMSAEIKSPNGIIKL